MFPTLAALSSYFAAADCFSDIPASDLDSGSGMCFGE